MSPAEKEPVYTRPLEAKLGIKPGLRVEIVDLDDPGLPALVEAADAQLVSGAPTDPVDLIFMGAENPADLERLAELRRRLDPNGAIWVISTKGRAATLRDVEVIDAAIASGLVDTKVVSFSATHTAAKLVIRLVDRPAHVAELARARST